jgi:hypothetical protein
MSHFLLPNCFQRAKVNPIFLRKCSFSDIDKKSPYFLALEDVVAGAYTKNSSDLTINHFC